jgi:hypothetical protein
MKNTTTENETPESYEARVRQDSIALTRDDYKLLLENLKQDHILAPTEGLAEFLDKAGEHMDGPDALLFITQTKTLAEPYGAVSWFRRFLWEYWYRQPESCPDLEQFKRFAAQWALAEADYRLRKGLTIEKTVVLRYEFWKYRTNLNRADKGGPRVTKSGQIRSLPRIESGSAADGSYDASESQDIPWTQSEIDKGIKAKIERSMRTETRKSLRDAESEDDPAGIFTEQIPEADDDTEDDKNPDKEQLEEGREPTKPKRDLPEGIYLTSDGRYKVQVKGVYLGRYLNKQDAIDCLENYKKSSQPRQRAMTPPPTGEKAEILEHFKSKAKRAISIPELECECGSEPDWHRKAFEDALFKDPNGLDGGADEWK